MEREKMVAVLKRQQWVILAQSKDLTHQESLLQLPFRGNCFNWVLGHILVERDNMLEFMGYPPLFTPEDAALYRCHSVPIGTDSDAVEIERLLELSRQSVKKLENAILSVSDTILTKIIDEESGMTAQERIEFLVWHEAYHLGQLEILRQLAGKDDAII